MEYIVGGLPTATAIHIENKHLYRMPDGTVPTCIQSITNAEVRAKVLFLDAAAAKVRGTVAGIEVNDEGMWVYHIFPDDQAVDDALRLQLALNWCFHHLCRMMSKTGTIDAAAIAAATKAMPKYMSTRLSVKVDDDEDSGRRKRTVVVNDPEMTVFDANHLAIVASTIPNWAPAMRPPNVNLPDNLEFRTVKDMTRFWSMVAEAPIPENVDVDGAVFASLWPQWWGVNAVPGAGIDEQGGVLPGRNVTFVKAINAHPYQITRRFAPGVKDQYLLALLEKRPDMIDAFGGNVPDWIPSESNIQEWLNMAFVRDSMAIKKKIPGASDVMSIQTLHDTRMEQIAVIYSKTGSAALRAYLSAAASKQSMFYYTLAVAMGGPTIPASLAAMAEDAVAPIPTPPYLGEGDTLLSSFFNGFNDFLTVAFVLINSHAAVSMMFLSMLTIGSVNRTGNRISPHVILSGSSDSGKSHALGVIMKILNEEVINLMSSGMSPGVLSAWIGEVVVMIWDEMPEGAMDSKASAEWARFRTFLKQLAATGVVETPRLSQDEAAAGSPWRNINSTAILQGVMFGAMNNLLSSANSESFASRWIEWVCYASTDEQINARRGEEPDADTVAWRMQHILRLRKIMALVTEMHRRIALDALPPVNCSVYTDMVTEVLAAAKADGFHGIAGRHNRERFLAIANVLAMLRVALMIDGPDEINGKAHELRVTTDAAVFACGAMMVYGLNSFNVDELRFIVETADFRLGIVSMENAVPDPNYRLVAEAPRMPDNPRARAATMRTLAESISQKVMSKYMIRAEHVGAVIEHAGDMVIKAKPIPTVADFSPRSDGWMYYKGQQTTMRPEDFVRHNDPAHPYICVIGGAYTDLLGDGEPARMPRTVDEMDALLADIDEHFNLPEVKMEVCKIVGGKIMVAERCRLRNKADIVRRWIEESSYSGTLEVECPIPVTDPDVPGKFLTVKLKPVNRTRTRVNRRPTFTGAKAVISSMLRTFNDEIGSHDDAMLTHKRVMEGMGLKMPDDDEWESDFRVVDAGYVAAIKDKL